MYKQNCGNPDLLEIWDSRDFLAMEVTKHPRVVQHICLALFFWDESDSDEFLKGAGLDEIHRHLFDPHFFLVIQETHRNSIGWEFEFSTFTMIFDNGNCTVVASL